MLDNALISRLPQACEVISVIPLPLSENCDTAKTEVRLQNGHLARFFQKSSTGQHGFELMRAHYESESSLYRFIPQNVPPPMALVTHESDPDRHSYLMEFVEMDADKLPGPKPFIQTIATLHRRSAGNSPSGMFGFGIDTKFAHLPIPKCWDLSWTSWWKQHMTNVFTCEARERGTRTQDEDQLVDYYLNEAIPRYIRPLESGSHRIRPTLLHTDLWPGNVKFKDDNETVCIFDANALWGHNEMELGLLANPRYPLGKAYIDEYWQHIPRSEPQSDADSRVMMYMIRHQACLASVYPNDSTLRDL
ncbi:Fructosamine/Ketosamine-3-kinase [Astrocystis sublimbata]|nr:Fructosamine/Ketosamine-3-kinase [Astrocystis sublimbata]